MNIISLVNEIVEIDKRLGNEMGLWLELDDDPCSDESVKNCLDDTITKNRKLKKVLCEKLVRTVVEGLVDYELEFVD